MDIDQEVDTCLSELPPDIHTYLQALKTHLEL